MNEKDRRRKRERWKKRGARADGNGRQEEGKCSPEPTEHYVYLRRSMFVGKSPNLRNLIVAEEGQNSVIHWFYRADLRVYREQSCFSSPAYLNNPPSFPMGMPALLHYHSEGNQTSRDITCLPPPQNQKNRTDTNWTSNCFSSKHLLRPGSKKVSPQWRKQRPENCSPKPYFS